ncbi:MAG: AbrB/MazE/SpoVT family DNA-binding domain-containing protein [Acidimicrobiia bacterium]|nr:AbrB/MazE/SpoVT family DNA-binding domain-containing protein [Acidimicrobiia bacterium]
MQTTIDSAGRIVIPKALRDEVGLRPGDVELVRDGAGIRIEPLSGNGFYEVNGRLVIPGGGEVIDDALVLALRDADRR